MRGEGGEEEGGKEGELERGRKQKKVSANITLAL